MIRRKPFAMRRMQFVRVDQLAVQKAMLESLEAQVMCDLMSMRPSILPLNSGISAYVGIGTAGAQERGETGQRGEGSQARLPGTQQRWVYSSATDGGEQW